MTYTRTQLVEIVRQAAIQYGIDPKIANEQIYQESRFNPRAGSGAGAKGIAQFMPATAARFGLRDPYDPVASMDAWGKYMTFLLGKFNGSYTLALAGYNAGEGAVLKYGRRVPPYRETQNYVKEILGRAGKSAASAASTAVGYARQNPETVTAGFGAVFFLGVGVLLILSARR